MNSAILEVRNLKKHFTLGKANLFKSRPVVKAVDGVSFRIGAGEILGLVGESGCGKTTIGRALTKLISSTSGNAYLEGEEILHLTRSEFKPMRKRIQMIFQDPFASLNPRLTIDQTISESLRIHGVAKTRAEAREKIANMLTQVGMTSDAIKRYPFEFSGGQRQRICIARAMIVEPKLVIADEPVSALDVSIQAQILNLIKDVQSSHEVSMLFISHDLGVVRHLSDQVAVMYSGKIVEIGSKTDIFSNPRHPYTQLLFNSILRIESAKHANRNKVEAGAVNQAVPQSGCAFQPRCSLASEICRTETPTLLPVAGGHRVSCHHQISEA